MANFLKELREELAYLYKNDTDLLLIAIEDAGLDPAYLDLNKTPIVNSYKVLAEAQKRNRLRELLAEVLHQYQEPVPLRRLQRQLLLADLLIKAQVSPERLLGVLRQCLEANVDLPNFGIEGMLADDVEHLRDLVNFLFGMGPRSGKAYLPVFEFVALVAGESPPPMREALRNWGNQTATALELTPVQTQVGALPKPMAGQTQSIAYIAIEIGRAAATSGEPYSLVIRLWYDDAPQPPLYCGYGATYTLAQIQQKWHETFLNPNTVSKISGHQVCLEFVVPHELLSYEFDRWRHPLKKNGETYGMLYPLVVRSWERAQASFYDDDCYQLWSARSQFARQDDCHFGSQEYTDWLCDPHKVVHTHLNIKWRLAKQLVCLKLAYKPTPTPARSDSAALWIDVGVPVAVWCRQMEALKLTPTALQQQLDTLFQPNLALKALPQSFVDLRLQAYNDDQQLGSHLALFWDDVARRPDLEEIAPSFYAP